ncbi:MAG: copper chaperone PCu(A)C, partial [Candidatus Tectimicrobiota bacterium]
MRAGRGGLGLLASWFGHRRGAGLAVVALLLAWGLAGCEAQVPTGPRVRAENVWSRPALAMAHGQDEAHGMGTTGVVYLTLANEGREADRLIAAKSNVAASVELHQTTLEGGVMKMQPVRSVTVPVG